MNRLAQGVVLLLFGGAVLRATLTDMYLRYVKESLQPFLIAASVLLLAAGAMTLWYELRRGHEHNGPDEHGGNDEHGGRGGHGGPGGHREPAVGWLLVAPVLGLLLVAPPALGSYSVGNAGTALTAEPGAADFPPLPGVTLVDLPVLDYAVRAVWDDGRSLAGRRVRLTGFLTTAAGGEQHLARLVMSCCAADARPIKVGMTGRAPAGLADDTWVRVIGTYVEQTGIDPINGATIPYLQVEHWEVVPVPSRPYE